MAKKQPTQPPEERDGERKCEHCGSKDRTVLIGMQPGPDGVVWFLCRRDWADGLPKKIDAEAKDNAA